MWRSRTASLGARPALARADRQSASQQGRRASDGSAVARRRAFPPGSHGGAGEGAGRGATCRSSCMPFWTAAIRRPKARAAFSRNSSRISPASPGVRMATVSGRYYAMDRDKRWDRVEKAMTRWSMPQGRGASTMPSRRWMRPMPTMSPTNSCCPRCWAIMPAWRDGDALLFANFRADRAREISARPAGQGLCRLSRATGWSISAPPPG